MNDEVIKMASIDILSYLVDNSPSMVCEYAFQQSTAQPDDQPLTNIVAVQTVCGPIPYLGGAVQHFGISQLVLDPKRTFPLNTESEFFKLF